MKKPALIFLCSILTAVMGLSQDFAPPKKNDEKNSFWDWEKVYYGGGIGMQFGSYTLVNVAPEMGYNVTERYSVGVGVRYMYYADNTYKPPYEINIYGASIFNRFIVTDFLFLHGEYEALNGPWAIGGLRSTLNNVWVGGGLKQGSESVSFNIMALWNLNDNIYIPNPQIRMGISIGM